MESYHNPQPETSVCQVAVSTKTRDSPCCGWNVPSRTENSFSLALTRATDANFSESSRGMWDMGCGNDVKQSPTILRGGFESGQRNTGGLVHKCWEICWRQYCTDTLPEQHQQISNLARFLALGVPETNIDGLLSTEDTVKGQACSVKYPNLLLTLDCADG